MAKYDIVYPIRVMFHRFDIRSLLIDFHRTKSVNKQFKTSKILHMITMKDHDDIQLNYTNIHRIT